LFTYFTYALILSAEELTGQKIYATCVEELTILIYPMTLNYITAFDEKNVFCCFIFWTDT